MTADLQAGRLEQACPDCGTWEAAGSYCTKCRRPMTPADHYRNGDLERRAVARQKAPQKSQTPSSRGPGRPSRASALPADGTLFGMTSPLRVSGVGSPPISTPQPGSGWSEPTPEPRRLDPVVDTRG